MKKYLLFIYFNFSITCLIAQPIITSFSPKSGNVGDNITITGINFIPNPSNNIVFFGATKAIVVSATPTSLVVTVPSGATFGQISVLNTIGKLIAYSNDNFIPKFSPAITNISSSNFTSEYHFSYTNFSTPDSSFRYKLIADFDNDGKVDYAIANFVYTPPNTSQIFEFRRNTSLNGVLSFSSPINYVFTSHFNHKGNDLKDINNDGLIDIITSSSDTIYIHLNNSVPGSINFNLIKFPAIIDNNSIENLYVSDLNNDGKSDILITKLLSNGGKTYFVKNTSTPTQFSFDAPVSLFSANHLYQIRDIDNDGFKDLVVNYKNTSRELSTARNNLTTIGGTPSFSWKSINPGSPGDFYTDLDLIDFNNDGKLDLIYSLGTFLNPIRSIASCRNNSIPGDISLSTVKYYNSPTGQTQSPQIKFCDLDGDGKLDIINSYYDVNWASNKIAVIKPTLTNNLLSSLDYFNDISPLAGFNSISNLDFADFNGDGKPDVFFIDKTTLKTKIFLNSYVPLPSILTHFTINKNSTFVSLNWITTTEINSKIFEVERSIDGKNFTAIGTVEAKGFASDYSFIDVKPFVGLNYYRLKMVDKDGKFEYSEIKTIKFGNSFKFEMYPNPAKSTVNILVDKLNSKTTLFITDIYGKQLINKLLIEGNNVINISSFSKGVYLVNISNDEGVGTKKLIID